jgi:hypothetical protein
LRVRGAPGLNGVRGDSEREFRVREPAPPPPDQPETPPPARTDTTAVRR